MDRSRTQWGEPLPFLIFQPLVLLLQVDGEGLNLFNYFLEKVLSFWFLFFRIASKFPPANSVAILTALHLALLTHVDLNQSVGVYIHLGSPTREGWGLLPVSREKGRVRRPLSGFLEEADFGLGSALCWLHGLNRLPWLVIMTFCAWFWVTFLWISLPRSQRSVNT